MGEDVVQLNGKHVRDQLEGQLFATVGTEVLVAQFPVELERSRGFSSEPGSCGRGCWFAL